MSALDGERKREVLSKRMPRVSGFHFDQWHDQESFILSAQANSRKTADLDAVLLLAGKIEKEWADPFRWRAALRWQLATVRAAARRCHRTKPGPVKHLYRTFQGSGAAGQPVLYSVSETEDTGIQAGGRQRAASGRQKHKKRSRIIWVSPVRTGYGSRNRITIIG